MTYYPSTDTYAFTAARLALHDRRVAATKAECDKWDEDAWAETRRRVREARTQAVGAS